VTGYILRRTLQAIPLLFGIATLTFVVIHLAPGDPMDAYIERLMRSGRGPAALEAVEALRVKFGLDQPLHVQYGRWLSNFVRGDLGDSFQYRQPVTDLLARAIPYTLQLTVIALLLEIVIGVALGVASAIRQGTRVDQGITLASLVMLSLPGFWVALMLILVFSVQLGWLPTSQTRSLDYELLSWSGRLIDRLRHLILPLAVLGSASAAGTARYMRNRMLDVLNEDYIVAAKARGLAQHQIIIRHALPNALVPIITRFGLSLPFLLGGAAIIETIFAWPGMGRLVVEAVQTRDYPLIMATTMMGAVLTVLGSLLADVLQAWVDPRVRLGEREGS